ncbi:hypothetical protein ACH4OT_19920 [Streptomyces murinus]|uniref:hypothetical protein n=1 Tax=Streptomyces murinus TaxID=33900 RepID=UPI0037B7FB7C
MYELSRVLLRGVGPHAARYEDVLLDFSGVGAPVANGRQGDVFDLEEPLRRPSPASVLFLENGGGKSVLIKLIFSVVLPGRRQVVGTRNPHLLDGFVLPDDVAHVVLEWTHARTGKRLVTGKVSQWKDRRTSTDSSNLVERWYHFRPGKTLDLEHLPIETEGKYLSLVQYCEELRLAQDADPALGYRLFQLQGEWTDRLAALGLDPELFRYQRAMNSDEGEAADAFSLGTDLAFVNFLLTAVLPTEPALDLAELLATYGAKLADRGSMELEKEFIEGTLALLTPLAQAREARRAADLRLAGARSALDGFIHRVRQRASAERAELARTDTEAVRLKGEVRDAADGRRRAEAVLTELRRRLAEMRVAEAQRTQSAAERDWREAGAVERAWTAVPAVLRDLEATTTARRLRERIVETKEAALPALSARDSAARTLSRALNAMVRDLEADIAGHETKAAEHDHRATTAQAAHDDAVVAVGERKARAGTADRFIADVQAEIGSAVRSGLVAEGMSVVDARALAESGVRLNQERVAGCEAEIRRLEEGHEQARKEHEAARRDQDAAEHAYDIACREFQAVDTTMRRLGEELHAADLYSGELADLDGEAQALSDRLARARDDAEAAGLDVRMAAAGDERALTALEVTDLLPSSIEAVGICDLLNAGGVSACTGWEYLASVPGTERREEIVGRAPHLVTGVLVNEADHLGLAADILAAEGSRPTGFIALSTTSAVHEEVGPPPGVGLVVPPHPALYDERAGEAERLALSLRRDEHQHQLAELAVTLSTHNAFIARLTHWRQECPPGRPAELADAKAEREESALAARLAASTAEEARDVLAGHLDMAREELRLLHRARPSLDRRFEVLKALAAQEERIPGWREEAEAAREAAAAHQSAAEAARTTAEEARLAAADARRTADALRATVDRITTELADLPDRAGKSDDEGGPAVADASEHPLEVLRHAYRTAAEEYARVAVGADLLADLHYAEMEERAAAAGLSPYQKDELATALTLLGSPDGADTPSRNAARLRAEQQTAVLRDRLDRLIALTLRHRSSLDAFPAPAADAPVGLDPFGAPEDVPHGERLVLAAEAALAEASEHAAALAALLDAAVQANATARQATRDFKLLVDVFGDPSEQPPVAPAPTAYEGDPASAREQHTRLHGEYTGTQAGSAAALEHERVLADRLSGHASDARFEELQSPGRRVIVATDRAVLPALATEWADDLRPRLRTLEIDLASITRHRTQIVRQFTQQVQEALRTLRRAQRLSRLPEGLGNWSGQQFLQISFTDPSEEVLHASLGHVIDEAASEARNRQGKRDARQLLLKGVETAAAPKGFQVTILKPDALLGMERVRVSETKDIFSGGQILTAAIVLYCTMAALRANDRGRVGHQHSGVLFLDNPIGRASALYLLRLQQSVAKALGVQLVYTTGLYDRTALDVFPLVIRMRNDADLRARRRYLSVSDQFTNRLRSSIQGDVQGAVAATRYYTRPDGEGTTTG